MHAHQITNNDACALFKSLYVCAIYQHNKLCHGSFCWTTSAVAGSWKQRVPFESGRDKFGKKRIGPAKILARVTCWLRWVKGFVQTMIAWVACEQHANDAFVFTKGASGEAFSHQSQRPDHA